MSEKRTNDALLVRIAARDEAALIELFTRAGPMLLGMVSGIVGDDRHAGKIMEETFVRLWREGPRLAHDGVSVTAWLVFESRRIAVRHRRHNGEKVLLGEDRFRSLPRSNAWLPRPEEVARLEERRHLLSEVVHQLPKAQRATLDLAVFEGLGEEEIAKKLGEPLGRVKSALRAGMRFIRHRTCAVLGTWSANI